MMTKHLFARVWVMVVCILATNIVISTASAQTTTVIDWYGDANGAPAVLQVDPAGNRSVKTDLNNPTEGPLLAEPIAITSAPTGLLGLVNSGAVLVLDSQAGTATSDGEERAALFLVNVSGQRSIFSDFGNPAEGPLGVCPKGITTMSGLLGLTHSIIVTDACGGTNGLGEIFMVDPTTGGRTVLSDFGNANEGPLGQFITGVAVAPAGLLGTGTELVVTDSQAGANTYGEVFIVDPTTGDRTVLSDFGNSTEGQPAENPTGVVVANGLLGLNTQIYVLAASGGTNFEGAIYTIDQTTGYRTLVTDFGNSAEGPIGANLTGLALGPSNNLLVTDDDLDNESGATPDVVSVSLTNGGRTQVSDFAYPALGPGEAPEGITVVQ